jgi:hypothetical protein
MSQVFTSPPILRLRTDPISLRSRVGRVTARELSVLAVAGGLAALAMAMVHLNLRIPGHAILKPLLPLTFGLVLVPRRAAGCMIAVTAAATTAVLAFGQWGELQLPALTSLVLLGPALDLAARGTHSKGAFLARFALAGCAVNLLAMGSRIVAMALGFSLGGGRGFAALWPFSLFSFVACGALAGILSAAICCYGPARNR